MTSMNFKYTYTSSEDVVTRCLRRRSAFNIFNKEMMTSNQSAEFTKAQMLKRNNLGGTTIFIKSEEEAFAGSGSGSGSGLESTSFGKCVAYTRKNTVLPLKNKF